MIGTCPLIPLLGLHFDLAPTLPELKFPVLPETHFLHSVCIRGLVRIGVLAEKRSGRV